MRYPDSRLAALADFAYPPSLALDKAEDYHEASKYSAATVAGDLHPARQYFLRNHDGFARVGRPSLVSSGPAVSLPPAAPLDVELRTLIRSRRSRMPKPSAGLRLADLATVLALAYGTNGGDRTYRTSPSAGALYPYDLVVVPRSVEGLANSVHVFDPFRHCLWRREDIDVAAFAAGATVAGDVPQPPALLGLVATFARTRAKYGLRGYRFAMIEAGHIVQTALLVATALGLDALPWGGFADRFVDRALGLDGVSQSCVYLVCLGASADGRPVTVRSADEQRADEQ